jgi:cation diffusion facilitator family transporter
MRWVRDYTPQPEKKRLYSQALWITILGNVLLAISKGIVAHFSGSVAVYADAANSVSDVIYSFLMVLGLWAAQQPPDLSHPQGHSRFEPLVGLLVTISMTLAGYEAARASLARFLQGGKVVEPGLLSVVLLVAAAVKAWMYFTTRRIGRTLNSPTLMTTAQDNLSDMLASVAAVAGGLASSYFNPILDPIAGFLVAAWIFRAAFRAGRENLYFLTGGGANEELRHRIVAITQEVPGVVGVHHLMTEYVGPRLVIDMHVNVDGKTPLTQSHAISDEVIARLQALPEVDRAYVHIEPENWVD